MIQYIFSFLILLLSFIFTQMKHPLSMGMMLLIQTFMISMLIGTSYSSFWFSYILFLIFIGGMLVLFIYVTSLTYNEMFYMSNKLFIIIMTMMMIMLFTSLLLDFNYTSFMMNIEMSMLNKFNIFLNESSINLNKLYNFPNNLITWFLINYLFLTLIIAVKITNFFFGPLRPSF